MNKQDALNELRAENTALRSVIADAHALLDAAGIGEPAHNLAGRVAALMTEFEKVIAAARATVSGPDAQNYAALGVALDAWGTFRKAKR